MNNSDRTIPQRTILSLLYETERESVVVNPRYLGDILVLQLEGLIEHQVVDAGIEVRLHHEQTLPR